MCCLNDDIRFLTENEVMEIHNSCIELFGGKGGIRDRNLFESAIYQPQQTFDGKFLYENIYEMAAMYLLSFAKDHVFFDGNKRTAIKTCMLFLELNNNRLLLNNDEAVDLTLKCVSGEYSKEDIVRIIRKNTIY